MALFILTLYLSCIQFISTHNTTLCIKGNFNQLVHPIAEVNTFKELIERSNVFVDKTLMLVEFLTGYPHIEVLTSPMSWGKSVILDMIKMFVEIRADNRGRELPPQKQPYHKFFRYGRITWTAETQWLKSPPLISQHPKVLEKYQGRFPVIHLSMRKMTGRTFLEIFYKFANLISQEFHKFVFVRDYLYDRMNNVTRNRKVRDLAFQRYSTFNYYLENRIPHKARIREGLHFLIEVINWYYEKRVFVFIDDYDTPFNCLLYQLPTGEVNKMTLFFKRFYEQTLKSPYLKKSILTGLFPINKNGTFMPYNTRAHTYMKHPFCEYFGFTQPVVDELFRLLNMEHWSNAARQWYNGYLTDANFTLHVYNPSSIIQFINQRQLRIYTKYPHRFDMLETMIRIKSFRYTFEQLINNKSISLHANHLFLEPKSFVTFRNLLDVGINYTLPSTVVPSALGYLASAGYLTMSEVEYHTWATLRIIQAHIPNKEMMRLISAKLIDRYTDEYQIYPETIDKIAHCLANFVNNNRSKSPPLTDSFEELLQQVDIELSDNDRHDLARVHYVGQLLLSMLNWISLKLRLDHHFETQVNEESTKPDFILRKDHHAAAIVIRYYGDKADNLLETVKQYENIFRNHTQPIKTVKFIGIEITSRKQVHLSADLQRIVE